MVFTFEEYKKLPKIVKNRIIPFRGKDGEIGFFIPDEVHASLVGA